MKSFIKKERNDPAILNMVFNKQRFCNYHASEIFKIRDTTRIYPVFDPQHKPLRRIRLWHADLANSQLGHLAEISQIDASPERKSLTTYSAITKKQDGIAARASIGKGGYS